MPQTREYKKDRQRNAFVTKKNKKANRAKSADVVANNPPRFNDTMRTQLWQTVTLIADIGISAYGLWLIYLELSYVRPYILIIFFTMWLIVSAVVVSYRYPNYLRHVQLLVVSKAAIVALIWYSFQWWYEPWLVITASYTLLITAALALVIFNRRP